MKIVSFLHDMFGDKAEVNISQHMPELATKFAIESFATQMAINMVAGIISKCEFRTFIAGLPVRKDDYYTWNIQPNVNQNANQFWQEVVSKLLYSNECLIIDINDQKIIADNYTHDEEKLIYPDTFSNVTRGSISLGKTFHNNEVVFLKLNNQDIRLLMSGMMAQYNELLGMAVGKYRRAGGRKGIMNLNKAPSGNGDELKKTKDFVNEQMRTYFESENAVVSIPRGMDYTEIAGDGSKKSTSEVQDISNLTKEAIARVAQAFRIPPALLQGDIADTDKLLDQCLTFCVEPICRLIETEINRKCYSKEQFLSDNCLKIDTTCVKHVDIFSIAVQADKLISDGIYSADEIREKVGDCALNTWWSKQYLRTKNYEPLTNTPTAGGDTG